MPDAPRFSIGWALERVDAAISKHGLTRDPKLDQRCERFLAGRPRTHQYAARSAAELAADVNALTDLMVPLVKERDQLLRQTENQKLWVKILTWAVSTEGLIILFLAGQLFSRLH
jgi:hypothetical protein